jgi:hypothetical protein
VRQESHETTKEGKHERRKARNTRFFLRASSPRSRKKRRPPGLPPPAWLPPGIEAPSGNRRLPRERDNSLEIEGCGGDSPAVSHGFADPSVVLGQDSGSSRRTVGCSGFSSGDVSPPDGACLHPVVYHPSTFFGYRGNVARFLVVQRATRGGSAWKERRGVTNRPKDGGWRRLAPSKDRGIC